MSIHPLLYKDCRSGKDLRHEKYTTTGALYFNRPSLFPSCTVCRSNREQEPSVINDCPESNHPICSNQHWCSHLTLFPLLQGLCKYRRQSCVQRPVVKSFELIVKRCKVMHIFNTDSDHKLWIKLPRPYHQCNCRQWSPHTLQSLFDTSPHMLFVACSIIFTRPLFFVLTIICNWFLHFVSNFQVFECVSNSLHDIQVFDRSKHCSNLHTVRNKSHVWLAYFRSTFPTLAGHLHF